MKILLYTECEKTIGKSGLGKAIKHQIAALKDNNIEYTKNPKDDYDIAHINFYGLKSISPHLRTDGRPQGMIRTTRTITTATMAI